MIEELDYKIERYVGLYGKVTPDQISHAFKLPKKKREGDWTAWRARGI